MGIKKTLIIGLSSLAMAVSAASAEDYPSKPLTMIVPFAAGGGTDTVARIAVPRLEETLGQKVVVKNVAGAGGTVGASELVAPDSGITSLEGLIEAASNGNQLRSAGPPPGSCPISAKPHSPMPMVSI